jgi:hypothetical protein
MAPEPVVRAQAVASSPVESFTCESSAAAVVRSDVAVADPVGDV